MTISVLLGNGDGTFGAATTYNTGNTPFSIALGDFDLRYTLDYHDYRRADVSSDTPPGPAALRRL